MFPFISVIFLKEGNWESFFTQSLKLSTLTPMIVLFFRYFILYLKKKKHFLIDFLYQFFANLVKPHLLHSPLGILQRLCVEAHSVMNWAHS